MPMFLRSLYSRLSDLESGQSAILLKLKELEQLMGTVSQNATLTFNDVQSAVQQIVNDNTSQNNAIAAQLQEVQTLIADYAASNTTPTQAQYQSVVAQLQAVHSLVQQNTAAVQASGTAITQADPHASINPGSGSGSGGTTTGTNGGSVPSTGPGTDPNQPQVPAGPAAPGENTSSGVGSLGPQVGSTNK